MCISCACVFWFVIYVSEEANLWGNYQTHMISFDICMLFVNFLTQFTPHHFLGVSRRSACLIKESRASVDTHSFVSCGVMLAVLC